MKMVKLFKNGDSQSVLLPMEFRFAGAEVPNERMRSSNAGVEAASEDVDLPRGRS